MSASPKAVDVLAIMDEWARVLAIRCPEADDCAHEEMRMARAAVAELFAADREYDEARRKQSEVNANPLISNVKRIRASEWAARTEKRRAAALAGCRGDV